MVTKFFQYRQFTHLAAAAAITLGTALPAQAFDWPWAEKSEARYSYCKGFVVAGLGSLPVEKLSRTQLWLAWNTINREGIPPATEPDGEYQAGHQQFRQLLEAGSLDQLRQLADGDCALGRN
ncbi:hypothetical protein FV139_04945 [Parahaliea maris]|uniref:Uncharacterized protein n=1 Tax=Parahaliea maris TaxID=2716870 RepID=A0A5C9A656_9GAMM|nr:hypothetical protein [Parahaliea maris]TXS95250.1 hypothetical protein FV139_04945 [Parahaliea maris]